MQDEQSGENQQPGIDGAASDSAAPDSTAADSTVPVGPGDGSPGPYGFGAPGQVGGYGRPGGYGQPGQPGGYPQGGYGYGQPGGSGYGGQPGGYSPTGATGGYGPPGGYEQAGQPTQPGQEDSGSEPGQAGQPGGFGAAGGYGQPGGYGYGPPGGYGQPGYGQPGYGPPGGYGQPGGYGPPGAYGSPGDYIQQQPPPRRRLTGVVAYIAVAAVAAAAGAGTVLIADHFDQHSGQVASGAPSNPFGAGGLGQPSPTQSPSSQVSSATEQAVYKAVQPGIVDITSRLQYQGGTAAATGMVISRSGLVLTNNHVINGTTGLTAKVVATGQRYTARFLGYDKTADVAVLQLENASGLKTVPIGDSSKIKLGDGVIALGNAGGTGGTTTVTGSITGLNQTITASDDGGGASERLTDMLRTNSNIVPGDSGGPLASTGGKVIGMDTAAATGSFGVGGQQDVGFAIPINRALRIAHQIITGQASASIQLGSGGFLGVLVPADKASNTADPKQQLKLQIEGENNGTGAGVPRAGTACIANDLDAGVPATVAPVSSGALVLGELCGTPAATAGLNPGDVITSVNGQAVTTPSSLTAIMKNFRPGSKVSVTWVSVSTGARVTRSMTLSTAPPQ
jgi:S1-C subfamily serine protease